MLKLARLKLGVPNKRRVQQPPLAVRWNAMLERARLVASSSTPRFASARAKKRTASAYMLSRFTSFCKGRPMLLVVQHR